MHGIPTAHTAATSNSWTPLQTIEKKTKKTKALEMASFASLGLLVDGSLEDILKAARQRPMLLEMRFRRRPLPRLLDSLRAESRLGGLDGTN